MEGRAQANTTHRSMLPSLQGSGKKIKSYYFIATLRTGFLQISTTRQLKILPSREH